MKTGGYTVYTKYAVSEGGSAMVITARVRRVGHSLVATIPRDATDALQLREGDLVTLEVTRAAVVPVLDEIREAVLNTVITEDIGILRALREADERG